MILKLDQQIECKTICERIQKMINQYQKHESLENKVISIKVVDLVDGGDKHMPKLEYKPIDLNAP